MLYARQSPAQIDFCRQSGVEQHAVAVFGRLFGGKVLTKRAGTWCASLELTKVSASLSILSCLLLWGAACA